MDDFGLNEMLEMQRALQDRYKDKYEALVNSRLVEERGAGNARTFIDKSVIFFDVGYTIDYPASGDWVFTNRFLPVITGFLGKKGSLRGSLAGIIVWSRFNQKPWQKGALFHPCSSLFLIFFS